jgi:hypothetical protein
MAGAVNVDPEQKIESVVPNREELLDELGRCFIQATVTRLLKMQREPSEGSPQHCAPGRHSPQPANIGHAVLAPVSRAVRTRRRRTHTTAGSGVKCKPIDAA